MHQNPATSRSATLPVIFPIFALAIFLLLGTPQATAAALIVLIGDSTVAKQNPQVPNRGWGQLIPEFFNEEVEFRNLACNGRSSKSFMEEGRWKAALQLQPKYAFILWGTNDAREDPALHTDPVTTFKDFLRQYADEAIAAGATPVLVTPIAQRIFDKDGKIVNKLAPYAAAMKEVATEKNISVIDLNSASQELYNRLGMEEATKLASKPTDKVHLNEEGARTMAKLISQAIPVSVPSLAPYLLQK